MLVYPIVRGRFNPQLSIHSVLETLERMVRYMVHTELQVPVSELAVRVIGSGYPS